MKSISQSNTRYITPHVLLTRFSYYFFLHIDLLYNKISEYMIKRKYFLSNFKCTFTMSYFLRLEIPLFINSYLYSIEYFTQRYNYKMPTLEFLISVALRLLILRNFSRGYALICRGYAY